MIHFCHWIGCKTIVSSHMWGCRAHWFALPDAIRRDIAANYREGQETDKRPSEAYIEAAQRAQTWIKENASQ